MLPMPCRLTTPSQVLDHEPALPLFLAANLEAKAEYESMAWISRRSLCQRVLLPRLEALGCVLPPPRMSLSIFALPCIS
jgi:hypothetical protein